MSCSPATRVYSQLLRSNHASTDSVSPVPHPLFSDFELRIQTDGDISPKVALVNCCKNLINDLSTLSREFTKEYELRRMIGGDAAGTDKQ